MKYIPLSVVAFYAAAVIGSLILAALHIRKCNRKPNPKPKKLRLYEGVQAGTDERGRVVFNLRRLK